MAVARRVVEELGCVVRTQRMRTYELREASSENSWDSETSIWNIPWKEKAREIVAPMAPQTTLEYPTSQNFVVCLC
jgi:hypothetical protein